MRWFDNMKIAQKLILSFCVVLVLMAILGLYSVHELGKINECSGNVRDNWLPSVVSLGNLNEKLNKFRRTELQLALAYNAEGKEKFIQEQVVNKEGIQKALEQYAKLISSDEERNIYNDMNSHMESYFAISEKITNLVKENKTNTAADLLSGDSRTAYRVISTDVENDIALNQKGATAEASLAVSIYEKTEIISYVLLTVCILLGLFLAIWIARKISNPINQVIERLLSLNNICLNNLQNGAREFANGKLDIKILTGTSKLNIDTEDETGVLAKTLNGMIEKTQSSIAAVENVTETVVAMNVEISKVVDSAAKGQLSIRGNSDKFNGGFKDIISGLNKALDEIISPLNIAAEYIDRISKGDLPAKITDNYNGDFNEIKNNVNVCIDAINALIEDTGLLAKGALEGKFSIRADETKHFGDFRKVIHGINDTLVAFITPIAASSEVVAKIAKGEIPEPIKEDYKGDFNDLKSSINDLINTSSSLLVGFGRIAKNVTVGNLADRARLNVLSGDWNVMMEELNTILDALCGQIEFMGANINNIAKGNIPENITAEYKGDFNDIKVNLNTCFDAIRLLINDSIMLSNSAVEGNFDVRADVTKHSGDYKEIMQGINSTLDTVVDKSKWYESIIDAVPFPIHVIDMNMKWVFLNKAFEKLMVDQKITKNRAEAVGMPCSSAGANICNTDSCGIKQLHKGVGESYFDWCGMSCKQDTSFITDKKGEKVGYVEIVQDLTSMIKASDYTKAEVERMAANLALLAKGDVDLNLQIKESDEYTVEVKEQFTKINNNLEKVKVSLANVIEDTISLSENAVEGKLKIRADVDKHVGKYKEIISGINNTLDAIMAPINEGVAVLEKMGAGDMTIRITSDYKGDHQLIKNSINAVGESLNTALGNVREAVEATASASNQISSSTEEMAAGANEQTNQTSEVASSVEEMTRTILENTKNVSIAAETAKEAGKKALDGGSVVNETIEGMNKIAEVVKKSAGTVQALGKSSDQIGEIVQVIDDIADQTNLLALNAAIEAARAGEQGRGFAVVADEVRKLAERTTKATKEIASMIRQIQKDTGEAVDSMEEGTTQVEKGKTLAQKAGMALKEIVDGSQKVVDIVSQVAAASEEQSSAAEEISKSIEAISSVTQQSAAGTQQIARAAEDLSRLTLSLEDLVNQFTVSNTGTHTVNKTNNSLNLHKHSQLSV